MFHKIRLLLLTAVLTAAFMCAGTTVWADATIFEAVEPDASMPAAGELPVFSDGDPSALSDEDEVTAGEPEMTAQASTAIPNLNDAMPMEVPDRYRLQANTGHLVLVLYYNSGCEPTLVYEETGKEPPSWMRYAYSISGSNYIKLYKLVKGKSYLLNKRSAGDRIGVCYVKEQTTLKDKKPLISASTIDVEKGSAILTMFKVKVPASGTIRLNVDPCYYQQSSYAVELLDHNKKALYNGKMEILDSGVGNKTIFGVKKGTYYVRVAAKGKGHDPLFQVTSTFQKRSITKAGTSKKKAKTIKLGQKVKGILYYGKNTSCWYKVKIKKAGTYVRTGNRELGWGNADRQGGVYYKFIGCNPRFLDNNRVELNKGTLYIKVYGSGNVNGYFDFTLQ